jgi:AcrR family transcriptional regulator
MPKISDAKRQETLEKIKYSASELFSSLGYHNTQIMDIVRAVGISAGTFYIYFKDKRDLFEKITGSSFKNLRDYLIELRRPVNIWDRSERALKLHETYTALFEYIDANTGLILMILRGSYGVDKDFDASSWFSFNSWAHDLAEDVQNWLDLGIITDIDPMIFGHAVVGMAMQIIHSYIVEKQFTRTEAIDAIIRMNMAMFDSYLTKAGRDLLEQSSSAHNTDVPDTSSLSPRKVRGKMGDKNYTIREVA